MRAPLVLPALFLSAQPIIAQDIRARVVADDTRQPIAGATGTLLSTGRVVTRTATDANGFFNLRPAAAGDYEIAVDMIGYASERRTITYQRHSLTEAAFVLKSAAIPLDPVQASAGRTVNRAADVGFARASHVVSGARLALLEQQSARPITLVRETGGLRVREFTGPTGEPVICVESARRIQSMRPGNNTRYGGCDWPVIVIDGVKIADTNCDLSSCFPDRIFRDLHLQDMESFEYVTPAEAGQRYGLEASASGALVIWTRGRGPHVDAARNRN